MQRLSFYSILMTATLMAMTAHADIGKVGGLGKIGSPVVPSNVPKPQNASAPATQDDEDNTAGSNEQPAKERQQLLDIAFSQKRVDFTPELRQAIIENEKNSPGSVYDVVSTNPDSSTNPGKAARLNEAYSANMNNVLQQMRTLGLPDNRVHGSAVTSETASDQDIAIFVTPK